MSTVYEDLEMFDEALDKKLLDEAKDDVGLENWELEDDENEELGYSDETDDSEETELTPEEEKAIVEKIRMINDNFEKALSGAIRKLLELNKTQDIKMTNEVIELDDVETYLLYFAFLPDESNPEEGCWVPVGAELIEQKQKKKRNNRPLPKFWEYRKGIDRQRVREQIDDRLECPMNSLVDIFNEWEEPYKRKRIGGEPVENFLVKVKGGRADSRQTQKVRECAKEMDNAVKRYYQLKSQSNDKDDSAYIFLCEELEEIVEELRKSIRKMNQKTMSQMIQLALGCNKSVGIRPEIRGTYTKYRNKILEILYRYDRDLFLSCFKKGENSEKSDIIINK